MKSGVITRRDLDALLDSLDFGPDDLIEFLAASPFYEASDPSAKAVGSVTGDIGAGLSSVFVRPVPKD